MAIASPYESDRREKTKAFSLVSKHSQFTDILRNGDNFFFPIFTSEEEMGDYHEEFSAVPCHFLKTAELARNNEKTVDGIVINAFSGTYIAPEELFDAIECSNFGVESESS